MAPKRKAVSKAPAAAEEAKVAVADEVVEEPKVEHSPSKRAKKTAATGGKSKVIGIEHCKSW
jgi:hypothetical protein